MKQISTKKFLSYLISAALLLFCTGVSAADDPRLDIRSRDDITPYAEEGLRFTRYTPWLKVLHLTDAAETTHGGEARQQIRCIDISPADNKLAAFGTDTSGVWMTTDGGEFWYNTTRNMIATNIADVMCHPSDTNIMLAYSVGTRTDQNGSPGIYRSADKGKSWTRVYTDYISTSITDKLFACDGSGNIYAATGRGIIKSTDGGKTWTLFKQATETNSPDNTARAASIAVSDDGQTIVACYAQTGFSLNGANITTDGGASWSKLTIGDNTDLPAYSFVIDPMKPQRYIAGIANSDGTYGLYISEDSGACWTAFGSASGSYTKVRSNSPVVRIRITEDNLYASYDSCDNNCRTLPYAELANAATTTSWQTIDYGNAGTGTYRGGAKMFWSQGIDICDEYMYVCSAGPNKYTFDNETWERKSSGFSGMLVNHFNMDDSGKLVLSCTDGNIVISDGNYTKDSAPGFTPAKKSSQTVATMTLTDKHDAEGDRLICWYGNSNTSKDEVGIIITEDNGETYEGGTYDATGSKWTFDSLAVSDPRTLDTAVLEYDSTGEEGYEETIYASCATSSDNGESWISNKYYLLDVSGTKMLGWDIYGTSPSNSLMYSSDRGNTWTELTKFGSGGSLGSELAAFFDADDPDTLWYKTNTDFGKIDISSAVKTSMAGSTAYDSFSALVQNPKYHNHMLLTCKNLKEGYCPTLYESYDRGNTWHTVPGFFGRRAIDEGTIAFSTTTDEVFLGSHNGIMVYEYNNFNYYMKVKLTYDGEEIVTTLPLDENNCITAPENVFSLPAGYSFKGWRYNGTLYGEGDTINLSSEMNN